MFKWLDVEPTWKQVLIWIPLSALGLFVYNTWMIWFVLSFDLMALPPVQSVVQMPIVSWSFLPTLFMLAFIEEFIFRFLPAVFFLDRRSSYFDIVFYIVVTSWAFGMVHGGKMHLIFQGAGGLLFSIVYLKYGGIREKHFYGLFASTATHTFFNATIALLLLCNGMDTF